MICAGISSPSRSTAEKRWRQPVRFSFGAIESISSMKIIAGAFFSASSKALKIDSITNKVTRFQDVDEKRKRLPFHLPQRAIKSCQSQEVRTGECPLEDNTIVLKSIGCSGVRPAHEFEPSAYERPTSSYQLRQPFLIFAIDGLAL